MARLLTTREAAEFLRVSESLLRQSRSKQRRCEGPPYLKLGPSLVRYRVEDLEAWLESHRVEPAPHAVGHNA
ncbi:MAG: DNA-binding protein [Actinobacteria bacterium]|nr:MAG: DNA-binding protein [Actinomycetota bacterium]